jgi:hypothetical protein
MPNGQSSAPVQRALWFVENRLSDELSLREVAEEVGAHRPGRALEAPSRNACGGSVLPCCG